MNTEGNEEVHIDLTNDKDVEKWCRELDCDEQTLRRCVTYVGRSVVSIESFLFMNRDWISKDRKGDFE